MEDSKKPDNQESDAEEEEHPDGPFSKKTGTQVINQSKKEAAKRGRKPIPAQWSRIIDLDEVDLEAVHVFKIEEDMEAMQEHITGSVQKNKVHWKPIYEPQAFWDESSKPSLANSVLSKRQLKTYGKMVTSIREQFRNSASQHPLNSKIGGKPDQQAQQAGENLGSSVDQDIELPKEDRLEKVKKNISSFYENEFIEPTCIASRQSVKNRQKLSLSDTIDIVEKVKFKWIPR